MLFLILCVYYSTAVESANQRVTHEAKTGVPPQQLGKQEHHQDGGRKVPNYLQMTKAAASKRVTRYNRITSVVFASVSLM